MKIKGIFLYLIDFIVLSLTASDQNILSKDVIKSFEKCPDIVKIIGDSKIAKYSNKCNAVTINSEKITEETVLETACYILLKMMDYLCTNNPNIASDYSSLVANNFSCPIDLVKLPQYINFTLNEKISKYLSDLEHCKQVCLDFEVPREVCTDLYKINNILRNLNQLKVDSNKNLLQDTLPENNLQKTDVNTGQNHETLVQELNSKTTSTGNIPNIKEVTSVQSNNVKTSTNLDSINKTKELKTEKEFPKPTNNDIHEELSRVSGVDSTKPQNFSYENKNKMNSEVQIQDFNNSDEINIPENLEEDEKIPLQNEESFQESTGRNEIYSGSGFFQAEESHFFFYFLMLSSVIIIGYLAFHNKNKILAYALEGRNSRRSRRRPNSARYRKLETNLEEVISSNTSHTSPSTVVY